MKKTEVQRQPIGFNMERVFNTIAMIIAKRENVKVTVTVKKIEE